MNHFYPKGTPITFTSGAYSDFGIVGQIVMIKDCHLPTLIKAYRTEDNPENFPHRDDIYDFIAWLIIHEHAMPMAGEIVHLGEYGNFDSDFTGVPK